MTESTASETTTQPETDPTDPSEPTATADAVEGTGSAEGPTDGDVPAPDESAAEPVGEVAAESGDDVSDADDEMDPLENEGEIAADYLEELLDIADLDGDLDMDVEGDRAAVSIVGGDVRQLVGQNGEVLEALQELTRLAVYRETGERSRLMLDVGGYRADRRSRLEKLAEEAVARVKDSGERLPLDAMTPFERKVVHDVVAASGLRSASEGEEPRRHVVVLPA